MTNLRKFPNLPALAALLTLSILAAVPNLLYTSRADAQIVTTNMQGWETVARVSTADDTDTILLIKYIGTGSSGLVAVSAAGDLTFTSGTLGAEAADTSLECPVSGALGGVIDVSDTACNTVGEVVNVINGSGSWYAVPIDAVFSDDINCGGSGCLKTISATQAATVAGLGLVSESAVIKLGTAALIPTSQRSMTGYLNGRTQISPNPSGGFRVLLAHFASASAFSTASSGSIIQVLPNYRVLTGSAAGVGTSASGTETVETFYGPIASAATTVQKVYVALGDPVKPWAAADRKLLVRTTSTGTVSDFLTNALAYRAPTPVR